jgi:hypothetical protein
MLGPLIGNPNSERRMVCACIAEWSGGSKRCRYGGNIFETYRYLHISGYV